MAENFYSLITTLGQQEIADFIAGSGLVTIDQFSVGDSNGAYYDPQESATALRNETYRDDVFSVTVDPNNPKHVIIEGLIPANHSAQNPLPFTIREVGIWSDTGDLFAIAKFPETYKPIVSENATLDLRIRVSLFVTNVESINVFVDPNVQLASKDYVDNRTTSTKLHGITNWAGSVKDGDVVYMNSTSANYDRALAEASEKRFAIGIADRTNSEISMIGLWDKFLQTDDSSAVSEGIRYYLSDTDPGEITTSPPVTKIQIGFGLPNADFAIHINHNSD